MNCKNQVVTINKFVNGGYGLAHADDGSALFARFGLPGERVSVDVSEQTKKAVFGDVVEVHHSHPDRIPPPCPYYGRCGGCSLQHASYDYQCKLKQQIVTELISASGSVPVREAASRIQPIRKSPAELHYRQRIRLAIDNRGSIGFRHFKSRAVVAVDSCLLAHPQINRCLRYLLTTFSFRRLADLSESLELVCNPLDGCVTARFRMTRTPRPADRRSAHALTREAEALDGVYLSGSRFALEGPFGDTGGARNRLIGFSLEADRPLTLTWEVGGFSQVNIDQNRYLIGLVTRLASPGPQDRILDLYCGMGNFSLPLALRGGTVLGIENQGSAIRSGIRNSADNAISNCHFEKSDVETACRKLAAENRRFDIIVCDPPRRGLGELVPCLARLAAGTLIYVSCDPATLCRDLAALTSGGFAITSIHPVDMFPQTHHIETVVAMKTRRCAGGQIDVPIL